MNPWDEECSADAGAIDLVSHRLEDARGPAEAASGVIVNRVGRAHAERPGEDPGLPSARAKLWAAAPELFRALRAVEWDPENPGYGCRGCAGSPLAGQPFTHAADCAVDAALRKARGET